MLPKKTTIKDIADAVGVSTSLVSFVMNNKDNRYRVSAEMTEKIKEAARKLNYQPNSAARSLRSGRSRTIGVIVSDISNSFFADIARCIEDNAFKRNYTVIFGSSDENAKKLENLTQVLINKGVDGLIIVPCEGSEEIIKSVAASDIPVVLLDRNIEGAEISNIVLNNRKATSIAIESLAESGSRNIHMISYDLKLSNIKEREAGYVSTMKRLGLEEHIKIHRVKYNHIKSQTEEIIRDITLGETPAEAIIFATNTLTVESLKALGKYNIMVPNDIAVVGFDGSEAFELYYTSISYIKQPTMLFGHEAVELLIKCIEEPEAAVVSSITLNPEMIKGGSSQKERVKILQ